MTFHPYDCAALQRLGESGLVIAEHHIRQIPEALQLILPNVAARALRKAVNEERLVTGAEQNDRPEPAGLTLVRTRDPLFDYAAAEVGVDHPFVGIGNRVAQGRVIESLSPSEAREPFILENSQFFGFPDFGS